MEAYEDCIEYSFCLNGRLVGICTLAPLSDSEDAVPSEDSNLIEKKQGILQNLLLSYLGLGVVRFSVSSVQLQHINLTELIRNKVWFSI